MECEGLKRRSFTALVIALSLSAMVSAGGVKDAWAFGGKKKTFQEDGANHQAGSRSRPMPPTAPLPSGEPSPAPSASPTPEGTPGPEGILNSKDVLTELILDASGSMKMKVQQRTKLYQAKRVLRAFMTEAHQDNMVLGLRVYGLQEKNCKDSKLVLNFGEKGIDAIDQAMLEVDPVGYGKTPLAYSLEEAAKDLKAQGDKPKRIIVVTDGIDTCNGDPCKIAKLLAEKHDLRIYVVGYTLSDEEREKLKCLADFTGGKYWDADDLNSLLRALKDLSNQDKNLFVKSPDPLGISQVWRGNKLEGEFVSSIGTHLEPGTDYRISVKLSPPYVFDHIKLAPREKRTLQVKGDGLVTIQFMEKLFTVQLLNEQGKPVMAFPSDEPTRVPAGNYKVKATAAPFAEAMIDDIRVVPGGKYEESIKGFGALRIDAPADRGPGPFGYYVFDDQKKVDLGSYLTGFPVVLPYSRYTVKSVGNCLLKNVYPDSSKVHAIPLPPPGQTVTFSRREKEDKEKDGKEPAGPVMLDSLTPEQIHQRMEEMRKNGI